MSLMRDEVEMSVRDLVVAMLTISDNVATDELIDVVGLERVNALTASLGMRQTRVTAGLGAMLDQMAGEIGYADYAALAAHEPADGPPSAVEVRRALAGTAALDPERGSCTTAAETVRLLQSIWTDRAERCWHARASGS